MKGNTREFMAPMPVREQKASERRKIELETFVGILNQKVSDQHFSFDLMEAIRFYCDDNNIDFRSLACKDLLLWKESDVRNSKRFIRQKTLQELIGGKSFAGYIGDWDEKYFSGRGFIKLGMSPEDIDGLLKHEDVAA